MRKEVGVARAARGTDDVGNVQGMARVKALVAMAMAELCREICCVIERFRYEESGSRYMSACERERCEVK